MNNQYFPQPFTDIIKWKWMMAWNRLIFTGILSTQNWMQECCPDEGEWEKQARGYWWSIQKSENVCNWDWIVKQSQSKTFKCWRQKSFKTDLQWSTEGEKRVPQYVLLDHLAPIWMVSSGYTYQQTSCFLTHIQVTEASFVGNDLLYELSLLFSNMCTMVNSSLDNNVVVHWKKSRNFWWLRERGVYWSGKCRHLFWNRSKGIRLMVLLFIFQAIKVLGIEFFKNHFPHIGEILIQIPLLLLYKYIQIWLQS